MERLNAVWSRVQRTEAWQAWQRYSSVRGNVLAGGVTYFSFLSLFPMLALAFAIFGVVLKGRPELLDQIRTSLDDALPGFVDDGSGNGLISVELPGGGTLATVGIVGVVGLLFAGLGWLGALRDGIRAIFGVKGSPGNIVTTKLRDLAVLVLIGLAVVVSAVVSGLAGGAASWLAERIGLGGQAWLVTVVGLCAQAGLNTGVVGLLLRVLSGVEVPWPRLRQGAIFGGVALSLIQIFASLLTKGASQNRVYGSIAVVVGLLVFLNFIARAILIAAAWAANELEHQDSSGAERLGRTTAQALASLPQDTYEERVRGGLPTFGARVSDRASLTAGAVLGATGALALGGAARGIRQLLRRH